MPLIELSPGQCLHYLDENRRGRQTVLLLHGLGVNGSSWQLQIPALTGAGFRVLVPDAPGFGQTPYTGQAGIASTANLLAALLQKLDTGPVFVAGISMGGTHALQLALDAPQYIRRLALVNTFARLDPGSWRGWLYFAFRFLLVHTMGLQVQAQAVAKRMFPHPNQQELQQEFIDQILQADPRGYRAAMRALARFDVRQRLLEIQAPTLVITGENDSTIPAANQQFLVQNIPGASQVVIPHAGHAVIAEQPEAFNQALLDFFLAEDL
jgi:3-oxoadipate enol-lactonase